MFMFKSKIRKSQNNIANHIKDIASQIYVKEVRDGFYELSTLLLKQSTYSRSYKKIDKNIKECLSVLESYISEGYINAAGNYEPWIRKFINARGQHTIKFKITNEEYKLFELKDSMYKKTDEINKFSADAQAVNKKIKTLSPNDPMKKIYDNDLKNIKNRYIAAKKQVEGIAGVIYGIVSHEQLKGEMKFYEQLRDKQIYPEELEKLATRIEFYQKTIDEANIEGEIIINRLYDGMDDNGINEEKNSEDYEIGEIFTNIIPELNDEDNKESVSEKQMRT